jgi:hypothetical protein
LAPRTAARSQPMRSFRCRSRCRAEGFMASCFRWNEELKKEWRTRRSGQWPPLQIASRWPRTGPPTWRPAL